jgi:hypothetical protein
MRHLPRDADFIVETSQYLRILRHFFRQELEGHRLSQPKIGGAVDLTHSTRA